MKYSVNINDLYNFSCSISLLVLFSPNQPLRVFGSFRELFYFLLWQMRVVTRHEHVQEFSVADNSVLEGWQFFMWKMAEQILRTWKTYSGSHRVWCLVSRNWISFMWRSKSSRGSSILPKSVPVLSILMLIGANYKLPVLLSTRIFCGAETVP